MKHALDALRDTLPVVATLPGEGLMHIAAGTGIKAPAKLVADYRAAKGLSERGVTESGPFDDTDRAIVQARPDPALTAGAEQVLAAAAGIRCWTKSNVTATTPRVSQTRSMHI